MRNILIYCTLLFGTLAYAGASNNIFVASGAITEKTEMMAQPQKHIVAKGETVYSIATTYRVSVAEIYKLNPAAVDGIRIGEVITLPPVRMAVARYIEHQVGMQETLYGVSRKYEVTVDDLKAANEGLDEKTLKAGSKIKIPVFEKKASAAREIVADTRKKHTVGKKETLYSLSKEWDVSITEIQESNPIVSVDGLKEGMVLYIPQTGNMYDESVRRSVYPTSNTIKIGILLPFLEDNGTVEKAKIVEYYEGFLIALKELKAKGLDAEVYTFDIGSATSTARLESILETSEVQGLSLVVGGISEKQIDAISRFAKQKRIKYIVPFGSANSQLKSNPYIYQAINSHSKLYNNIADAFVARFPKENYNYIFVGESLAKSNKKELIELLKKKLTKAQAVHKDVTLSSQLNLAAHLSENKKNVIIPTSSDETTLRRIMPLLSNVDSTTVSLFGYPEWQIYTSFAPGMHKFDTYLYSIFYFNDKQAEVKKFEALYQQWFGKELVNSFPKYAHMGYDTGLYFLTALQRYGNNFEPHLDNVTVPTLQSTMYFDKVGEGGRINNGFYFIHYKTNRVIEKIEYNKK